MTSKITVTQIAEAAGVSPSTVSRVLHRHRYVKQETVQKVKESMEKLEIPFPENPPVSCHHPVIIVNIPNLHNILYLDILHGITASANAHCSHMLINQSPLTHSSLEQFIDLIETTNAKGIIVLNQVPADILTTINNLVPVIQCCEFNSEANLPYVSINDYKAAYNTTEYILSTGRNKIAFINGPLSYKYARERQQGFIDAMTDAGISVPANWIVSISSLDCEYDMAYVAASRLLTGETIPNAFFGSADTIAASIIKAALHYHFKVPKDIAVVGFDNTNLSTLYTPTITTVEQPSFQEGFTACEMLFEKIQDPSIIQKPILFETKLIVQESTR